MNARKFVKTIPMKLYAFLLAAVLFSFFSNDFGLVDIQKTAIILAIGIDKAEEGFTLTTQIAVPKGTDREQGGTSTVEISTTGATVSDCVTLLSGKTGRVPKLVFCDLIVLGEEAAAEDTVGYLNYFLRNEYMNDSCKLAVCAGKAEELICSKSALDEISCVAVLKLFSDAAEKSGMVLVNTLKDFAVGYYSVTESGYLPLVRMAPQKGTEESGSTGKGGSGSESGSGSSQGGGSDPQMIYTASETALFYKGKMKAVLPAEQTLAYSLLKGKVEAGTFNADDGEKPVTLAILADDGSVTLDMKGAPKAILKLDVMARLCCRGTAAPIEDVATDSVPEELLQNGKTVLEGYVRGLWETVRESGCDLFGFKRDLYRSSPKKYEEWKDFLLSAVRPEIHAEVESVK